jgi:hypothetical protein
MNEKSILNKVQKLLSLANSDNEHEAKLAMDRANELLVKHNLTMQQAQTDMSYERNVLDDSFGRSPPEFKYICDILCNHFFVKIISSAPQRRMKTSVYIMGTETNVAIATYVYGYLKSTFKSLYKVYKKETGSLSHAPSSYYAGLHKGLKAQLSETKKKVEQKAGLVLVPDAGLSRYMTKEFPSTRSSKSRSSIRDRDAFSSGKEAGRNIRISRGISSTGSKGLYLA